MSDKNISKNLGQSYEVTSLAFQTQFWYTALSRKLDLSKSTLDSSLNSPNRQAHAESMLKLDREKFALAKNINELESGSHALETTLARLKEELENVGNEEEVNKENEDVDDATMYFLAGLQRLT